VIFSELYSAYYNTVAGILKTAVDHPLQKSELRHIIEEQAFGESILSIEPALIDERWKLLRKDGTTPIKNIPSMPLTTLQKRWLKSIALDPRIRLFNPSLPSFEDVEPLFTSDDYCIFDKYTDGDPYEDDGYIRNFRLILDAVRNRYPLRIDSINRKENSMHTYLMPEYLEYSEKDDKFRLIGSGNRSVETINLGRIVSCNRCDQKPDISSRIRYKPQKRTVEFELVDERNALERVLLHFAHFENEAEKLDERHYRIRVTYDKDDETEIVIRILSFGPMIKVTAPQHFTELIKERLIKQKSCGQ
jgi:hypothetical protein